MKNVHENCPSGSQPSATCLSCVKQILICDETVVERTAAGKNITTLTDVKTCEVLTDPGLVTEAQSDFMRRVH